MVDNRGITSISGAYFKADNASANKMSEEKYGQGGEYFAQDMQEEEENQNQQQSYQDRSAQLRASLNGLAMANAGSVMLMKTLKEKENKKLEKIEKRIKKERQRKEQENEEFFIDD